MHGELNPDRPSDKPGIHEGPDDRLFSLFHRLGTEAGEDHRGKIGRTLSSGNR